MDESPNVDNDQASLDRCRVFAKVTYDGHNGRTYFVIGETESRCRLATLDSARDFWTDKSACKLVKEYPRHVYRGREEYQTIGSLRRFVEQAKKNAEMIKRGEIPEGYALDLEDNQIKPRNQCDMPAEEGL